jgi:DNA-binding transcriptional MerR regulator
MNKIVSSTREAANIAGLEFHQARYMVQQKIIQPVEYGQGKAREFSFRDLVKMQLAAELRKDGFRVDAIKQAMAELDANWTSTNPSEAGLIAKSQLGNFFVWQRDPLIWKTEYGNTTIRKFRKILYDVTEIAFEIMGALDYDET